VILTVHRVAIADIVPHGRRSRWVPGDLLHRELAERAAGAALRDELNLLAGQTLDELRAKPDSSTLWCSSPVRSRMRELERENKELHRANEILKAATHFFGAELDRQPPR